MRTDKQVMLDLIQGWERQLEAMRPREISAEEKDRVELATLLFNQEARSAVSLLVEEVKLGYITEERLTRDLKETKRKLTLANHQISDLRAKNRKLKS